MLNGTSLSRRQFLSIAAATSIAGMLPERMFAAKKPDERSAFFISGTIPKLALEITKSDVQSLKREPRKYVSATLTDESTNTVYPHVGVHIKGSAGSLRDFDDRPGLTFNVDKYVEDQRYRGMGKFHLNNSVQDPSLLTDLICGEMFRGIGVPASLITHALVTLNGRSVGLYVLKEGFDKTFLKNHFGSSHGNFYDGGFLKDIDQPLELVHGDEPIKDQAEIKALVQAVREDDPEKRFQKMEGPIDIDKFIRFLAMEVAVWDWDGYPMQRNNYRIYHDPKSNKITFIPSGMDQMWHDPNGGLFPNFNGMVARRLLETKEGRKRYLEQMRKILKESYPVDDLLKRLDVLQKRLVPVIETLDKNAARDYPNHVERLRNAIPQRAKSIKEQLEQTKE